MSRTIGQSGASGRQSGVFVEAEPAQAPALRESDGPLPRPSSLRRCSISTDPRARLRPGGPRPRPSANRSRPRVGVSRRACPSYGNATTALGQHLTPVLPEIPGVSALVIVGDVHWHGLIGTWREIGGLAVRAAALEVTT